MLPARLSSCLPDKLKLPGLPSHSTYTEKYTSLSDTVPIKFDRQFVLPTWKQRKQEREREKEWFKTRGKHDIFVIVVQSLSRVRPFETPWTVAQQASLSFTISWLL